MAFRALQRSEVIGVLYEWVVSVLVAFSVFSNEEWRWVRCWGLISVCGTNVVCVVLEDVVGRDEGLRWVDVRMFAWGVLWISMSGSCVFCGGVMVQDFGSFGAPCFLMVGCGLLWFRGDVGLSWLLIR